MPDLERRLEELFTSDSSSRRVRKVDVRTRRSGPLLIGSAFVCAVALALLVGLALGALRGPRQDAAASPVPSVPPLVSPGATSGACPNADPRPPAVSGAKLGRHGVLSLDSVTMGADFDALWLIRIAVNDSAPADLELSADRVMLRAGTGVVPVFKVHQGTTRGDPVATVVRVKPCSSVALLVHTKSIATGGDYTLTLGGVRLPEGTVLDVPLSLRLLCEPGPPAATVCLAPGQVAAPTPTVGTSPTPAPGDVALPGAERFAVVVDKGCSPPGPPPYVRREDRQEVIAQLGQGYLCQLFGVVSPDGRRLAYWLVDAGRSELALYENGTSRTLVRLQDELLIGGLIWSGDGTGILFVASKGGVQGVPPEYAALRTLDLATGTVRELTRVSQQYLSPLAWDRRGRIAAAEQGLPAGGREYLVVGEDGAIRRHVLPPDVIIGPASPDAVWATGLWRSDNVLRYWPIASFDDRRELRPEPGTGVGLGTWRPGSSELAVVIASSTAPQRVEIWSLDGSRRTLATYTGQDGGRFFRPDGSVLFIGTSTAVDIASGRVVRFALAPFERLAASILVR